jgi:hypothetical protein
MTRAIRAVISSGEDDATEAYLFRALDDPAKFAITRDRSGANLPVDSQPGGWVFETAFALGVREAMPIHASPEPVLRGLQANGYFISCDGSNPKGTSQ